MKTTFFAFILLIGSGSNLLADAFTDCAVPCYQKYNYQHPAWDACYDICYAKHTPACCPWSGCSKPGATRDQACSCLKNCTPGDVSCWQACKDACEPTKPKQH